ncbi:MAG: M48 family metalloprotease [Acidobacteria bacterium]|nr:M48 family metalloprotease [Acidobacteriota bacterium]
MRTFFAFYFALIVSSIAYAQSSAPPGGQEKPRPAAQNAAQQPQPQQTQAPGEQPNTEEQTPGQKPQSGNWYDSDDVHGSVFYTEALLVEAMHKYAPMVETYIQNLKPNEEIQAATPASDTYFLGRLILDDKGLSEKSFEKKHPSLSRRVLARLDNFYRMNYLSLGFMQLVFLNSDFDKEHYKLKFLRQQFLGEVRTLVYDVSPTDAGKKKTHFVGRIWVEDQEFRIVRINGTYEPRTRENFYFHFDSWRTNLQEGLWLPAYVYTEESDTRYMVFRKLTMKGQTRLWGYKLSNPERQDEMSAIEVEQSDAVKDSSDSAGNEFNPLESQRHWEREAEDNVLDRLERAGVLAPQGAVDRILQTVVNNLVITNKLDIQPEVRARVLMTTPLESFTIGHTIVISRGLLDVLPDESALAMMLGHELAHIALGHRLDTRYAFSDRMIFPDEQSFRRIELTRKPGEEEEADKKAIELLKNSPYAQKMASAGLFLKALQQHAGDLKQLINPRFGSPLAKGDELLRMAQLMQGAPNLQPRDLAQVPALPLGSRIYVNPWSDELVLKKTKAPALLSARDKMEFEVTPVYPNLVRYNQPSEVAAAQGKPDQP